MNHRSERSVLALSLVAAVMLAGNPMAQMPAAIATPEEATVVTLHTEGAQIYECKAGSDRKLVWCSASRSPRFCSTARRSAAITPDRAGSIWTAAP